MILFAAGFASAVVVAYLGIATYCAMVGLRHARTCPFHSVGALLVDAILWPEVLDFTAEGHCK